jgi:predicted choloylglycine hydrolase
LDKNKQQEKSADYKTFIAEGSHYQIGKITAKYGGAPLHIGKDPSIAQLRYAKACRKILEYIYPEIIEEFQGYCEYYNLDEKELLMHYSLGVEGGCSSVAIKTNDGMYVARNYDFYYWENRRHLIYTKPNNGWKHIGMHEGLIGGRFDGMNEHGLFINFNGAGPHPENTQVGISFHIIVRYLLEKFKTAKDARKALMSLPVKEPKSYLIADKEEAYVVEAHMDRKENRELNNNLLVMTNHFVHSEMKKYQDEWPNSKARYDMLVEQAKNLMKMENIELKSIKKIMADHEAPVCGHEDGLATFWSCIAKLNTLDIYYSLGAPCRNEYKQYFKF